MLNDTEISDFASFLRKTTVTDAAISVDKSGEEIRKSVEYIAKLKREARELAGSDLDFRGKEGESGVSPREKSFVAIGNIGTQFSEEISEIEQDINLLMEKLNYTSEQLRQQEVLEAREWKKENGFEEDPNVDVVAIEGCRCKSFFLINAGIAIPVSVYESDEKDGPANGAVHGNIHSQCLCPCCQTDSEGKLIIDKAKELKTFGKIKLLVWPGIREYDRLAKQIAGLDWVVTDEAFDYPGSSAYIFSGLQQEALDCFIDKQRK
jgi:hypothetical protein